MSIVSANPVQSRSCRVVASTLALSATPALAWAHPGEHHQGWWASIMHLVSEPDHVLMLVLATGAGVMLARWWWRSRKLRHPKP